MLFACDASQISKAVDYVRDELRKRRIRSEEVTRAMLAAEEILNAMIRHAPSAEESVNVRVVSLMHNTSVRITCRGTVFDLSEVQSSLQTGGDPETDAVISDLFIRIMSNSLSLKNRNGINYASLQVAAPRYRHLILTLGSLAAGILVGILLRKILPEGVNAAINTNLFTPISTMFRRGHTISAPTANPSDGSPPRISRSSRKPRAAALISTSSPAPKRKACIFRSSSVKAA